MKFQGYFKEVKRLFQESFKGVSGGVSRVFQGNSKEVYRVLLSISIVSRLFKEVLKVLQGNFKCV